MHDFFDAVLSLAVLFAAGASYKLHGKVDLLRSEVQALHARLTEGQRR